MDATFRRFLENTAADALALQERSDVVALQALPPAPASRYLCSFRAPFLRRLPAGTVTIDPGPIDCTIRFPSDYLWCADPRLFIRVAAVMTPGFVHPNVLDGIVCLGAAFAPGTPIRGVVWQLFEIVTYRNCTLDERNALNYEACRLLRSYPDLIEKLARPCLFRLRRPRGDAP
jgi:hypothetical protein